MSRPQPSSGMTPTVNGCRHAELEIRHAVDMLKRLNELRLNEDSTCDFTLSAGSESFKVHRAVLIASSEYFRAMLHGPMIESTCSHVDLKAVEPEALSALVTFIYTGRLVLSWQTVASVVHAASHLQVDDALERCCAFLMEWAAGSSSAANASGEVRDGLDCDSSPCCSDRTPSDCIDDGVGSSGGDTLHCSRQERAASSSGGVVAEGEASRRFGCSSVSGLGRHTSGCRGCIACGSGRSSSLIRLCDVASLAETYSLADVAEFASGRLARDFARLARSAEPAVELSAAALARLLDRDDLAVGSELEVFGFVGRWCRAQAPPCSHDDLSLVFGRLRYATMPRRELLAVSEFESAATVASVDSGSGSTLPMSLLPLLRQQVAEALDYQQQVSSGLPPARGATLLPWQRGCRNTADCLVIAVDGSSSRPFQVIAFCRRFLPAAAAAATPGGGDSSTDGLLPSGEPKFYRLYSDNAGDSRTCGLAAVDGFLYVLSLVDVGGFDHDRFLSLSRLDPRGLHPACELQRPPRSRQVGAVVGCGQHIYALGGASLDGCVHTADCDRYDVTTNAWEALPSLPCPAHFIAAAERQGEIYVCGGQARPSGSLSRFCWTLKSTAVAGKSIGSGCNSVSSSTCATSAASCWQSLPDMITPRRSHAMVVLLDKVYVLGGLCDAVAPSTLVPVEQFDVALQQWTQLQRPMTVRGTSTGHYVALGDAIYALGHELYNAVEDEIWRLLPAEGGSEGEPMYLQEERLAVVPQGMSLGYCFATVMRLNVRDPLIANKWVGLSPYRTIV